MNCEDCLSFICLLSCLVCYAASKPYVMPDVKVEWGSGKVNIQCIKEEDRSRPNITMTNLYYSKDGEAYFNRIKGKVTYIEASNESVRLNDDCSLSLPADYSSIGEYVCRYWRLNSFIETRTKVIVLEPPLRVLECNTTAEANHSTLCQVTVPNGTRSLTFTVIKAGLRSNRTISAILPSDVSILTETNDTTANDDNSNTISVRYEVDVSGLTSSSNLSFILEGPTKEVFLVVLNKAQRLHDDPLTAGQITGTVIGVIIALVVLCAFVILAVLVKPNRCSLTELTKCFQDNGNPVPTEENEREVPTRDNAV